MDKDRDIKQNNARYSGFAEEAEKVIGSLNSHAPQRAVEESLLGREGIHKVTKQDRATISLVLSYLFFLPPSLSRHVDQFHKYQAIHKGGSCKG